MPVEKIFHRYYGLRLRGDEQVKLFEYMGKELLAGYGVPVPRGRAAGELREVAEIAGKIGPVVIKSQVLSGKRGKAGGIKFASTPGDAVRAADELLGSRINGLPVEKVLVEQKLNIEREYYLAVAVDGAAKKPVVIASSRGGMDIEEVPDQYIVKVHPDIEQGLPFDLALDICKKLEIEERYQNEMAGIMGNVYQVFRAKDAELVEINPLVFSEGIIIAADAKVVIDDEALFRQQEIPYVDERTPVEKQAYELGLSYVELDGNIAIMANGAGITMATLDTIQHYGGSPANFLDAGGGTGMEATARALEILLAANPRAIFINIFGGITRCDDVANAFVKVKESKPIPVPVVIRLVGTNQAEGQKILRDNGIGVYESMEEAVVKVVELASGN